MKKIAILFTKLQQQGIRIKLVEDKLVVEYEGNDFPAEIKSELQANKLEIIEFLRANTEQQKAFSEIIAVEKQVAYPLSNAQKRLWVLEQFGDLADAYHIIGAYRFSGELDKNVLQKACLSLIERHESLRTRFVLQDNEPMQQIIEMAEVNFEVSFEKLNNDDEKAINDKIQKENETLFDLEAGVLFRIKVLSINPELNILVYTLHHIIADGWSGVILGNELSTLYNAFLTGINNPLSPLRIQYKDFAHWQGLQLSNKWAADAKKYWLTKFEDEIPILEFPTDFSRPIIKSYKGAIIRDYWAKEEFDLLQNFAHSQGVSMFMLMLAGLNVLLNKYTGQADIVVGVPVSGREHNDLNNQIGYYINAIPLRNIINSEEHFKDYLSQIKEKTLQAFQYQNYPINLLSEELKMPRDTSRNLLFDVLLDYHNFNADDSIKLGNSTLQVFDLPTQTSKFDFSMICHEHSSGLYIDLNYSTSLFSEHTARRILIHFRNLFSSILENNTPSIKQLNYLSNTEIEQQLFDFIPAKQTYVAKNTLVSLFEEQVLRNPNSTALEFGNDSLNYKALNERSNQLANYLNNRGIQQGDYIGVCLERSFEMVISLFAILKVGAAYIPIDPNYPLDRIQYILEDSDTKFLLTDGSFKAIISENYSGEIICLATVGEELKQESKQNIDTNINPRDLAYIIYTSGSTGRPKGAMLSHTGVVNRINWQWNQFGLATNDVILQKTTYCFDVSVWEFFMTLCYGSKLVLCTTEAVYNPLVLSELIADSGVTTIHFVPSMYRAFLNSMTPQAVANLKNLKHIFLSGEALTPDLVGLHYAYLSVNLQNLYGPTEASVDVSFYETKPTDSTLSSIPIGKPIANTELYILDNHQSLLPIGSVGELYIGGIGIAKGYLNQPQLTSERFVQNPFKPQEKLYRTGDLAKWQDDGNILYVGRIDFQVKIRGFRIELGEIENTLKTNPLIKNAVVLCKEDAAKEKYLVAYLEGGELLTASEWREYLRQKLPDYMIPTYFVEVEKWHLTSNGKLNNKLLPDPFTQKQPNNKTFEEPNNEIEWKIYNIIKDVLSERNFQNIDINENFFEVGMDSLKVVKSFKIIDEAYPNVIKVHEVFSYSSIKKLAFLISERTEISPELIENNIEILDF
jgi:amino acid adenylation domain-containing protein